VGGEVLLLGEVRVRRRRERAERTLSERKASVIEIIGRIVSDGELSGNTIVLRLGGKLGEISGITIRVPPTWDYSSCLESVSSDILERDTRLHPQLDDLFIGLGGARITLFKINPNKVILECGSIRIEKRLNRDDAFLITDHDRKVCYKVYQGQCVEESL
jgi:hypothetical protein